MQKIKKAISIFMCASLLAITLYSCSAPEQPTQSDAQTDETSTATDNSAESGEKREVSLWTSSRHDLDYMSQVYDNFNETNTDNIELIYEVYTDDYNQVLDLAFSTDSGPDIFSPSDTNALAKQGRLLPLNDYLTDEFIEYLGGEEIFIETINMVDGQIYTLPFIGTTGRLFYNVGIFERAGIESPPTTLDEMVETARIITEELSDEGIYGFAINLKSPASGFERFLDFMTTRMGGAHKGYDFSTGRYDFESYKPAIEAIKQIHDDGSNFPGSEQLDIDPLRTQFAAGNIGMYLSLIHAEPGVYENQFPTEEVWNCSPLPTADGEVYGAQGMWGGGHMVINSQAADPEAAFKVIELLHSPEVAIPYYEQGLGIVAIQEVVDNAQPPAMMEIAPSLAIDEYDKVWPSLEPIVIEGEDYYSMFAGHVLGNENYSDLDVVISTLNDTYNTALETAISEGTARERVYPDFDPMNPVGTSQD